MTHDTQHLTEDEIREKAENCLNFKFSNRTVSNVEIEKENGFYHITVKISPTRNQEATTYKLQSCPVCGETQPVNFSAYKKMMPKEAKGLLENKRSEKAEKYVETGTTPPEDERLKRQIETAFLNWDNTRCEQTPPPR